MDSTQLIVELAKQIEAQQAYHHAPFWLALIAIGLVTGGLGAFLAAYFTKRGETQAIKADLTLLKQQQTTIALAVKQVESDVSHAEWKRREGTTLKREKLEQLIGAAFEAPEWSFHKALHVWGLAVEPPSPDPSKRSDSLAAGYFQNELRSETLRMSRIATAMMDVAYKEQLRRAQGQGIGPDSSLPPVSESARRYLNLLFAVLLPQSEIVARTAGATMRRILDEPQSTDQDPTPATRARALTELRSFLVANGVTDPLATVFP
jgi:hypothetical protein